MNARDVSDPGGELVTMGGDIGDHGDHGGGYW